MQKPAFLLLLFLVLHSGKDLPAQRTTWISLDAGPQWSLVKVDDPGGLFSPVTIMSSSFGAKLEQQISGGVSVSAGLFYQAYQTGMAMEDSRPHRQRLEAYNSLNLPIRLHYSIQPTDYPVFITPHIGYVLRLGSMEATGLFSDRGILSAPDGTAFSYTHSRVDEQPGMHLLELGLGVGIRFPGNWQASARLSWTSELLNSASTLATVEYSDQQGRANTAVYNSRGEALNASLALHMPLSNIWQNRDYRIRSRIEHGTFDGKRLDRKGSFYLGGDVGVLWRLFHSSDPALAARPMENRGFLRYANLRTGIYAGYMPGNELGVDLGVYYRRSSSFYSLMYDHEVDFTGKSPAPLYLEIPLRVRYFYEILENKLHAVVYGGASLLTQFASGSEVPGGSFSFTDPHSQTVATANVSGTATRLSSFRPLLNMGLGAEYRVPIKFPLLATLYVNYTQGFLPTEEINVSTTMFLLPSMHKLEWEGSAWSIDLGVKVPLAFDDRQNCVRLTREKKIR